MKNIDFLKRSFIILSYFLGCLLQFSCSQSASTIKKAEKLSFQKTVWHTNAFAFASWVKIHKNKKADLVIYIEGDGRLMVSRHRFSTDPTPKHPLAFQLALQDQKGHILYFARPCQYLDKISLKDCPSKYWLNERYADEVVEGFNQSLNQFLKQQKIAPQKIGLVGFSGGATISLLLAARRTDIDWVITIAGNLDLDEWVQYHHAAPLIGSLSALDVALKLKNMPQRHFWGTKDRIISKATIENYINRAGHPEWFKIIDGYQHQCCWIEDWRKLICNEKNNPELKMPWLRHFCQ